jgi:AraC-like DNA-binding protein
MRMRGMPPFGLLSEKEKDRNYVLDFDGFIFTSPYVLTPSTARNTVAILLAIDSPPFLIGQQEGMVKSRAVVVGNLVPRALAAVDVKLISINVCPADPCFHILVKATKDRIVDLPRSVLSRFDTDLESLYAGKLGASEIRSLYNGVTSSITAYAGSEYRPNPYRSEILNLLRLSPEINLGEVADRIGVSYAGASRIFSDAIGTPLRSFTHANRLQSCLRAIAKKKNLTEIAYDAGFADSAHFANAWRNAFGMPPSYMAKGRSCDVFSI